MEMKCPFGNNRCLCQTCTDSWLNCGESRCLECLECDDKKQAVHDVYLCTGHKRKNQNEQREEGAWK